MYVYTIIFMGTTCIIAPITQVALLVYNAKSPVRNIYKIGPDRANKRRN